MRFSVFAFVLLCVSCARPRYENVVRPQETLQKLNGASCDHKFSQSSFCLSWAWETQPTEKDPGALVFKIFRPNLLDQSAVLIDPGGDVGVELWMPGMRHGSDPVRVERVDVGTFRGNDVFFVMPGHWQIKFQLRNGESLDEAIVDLDL